jgi:hypothetical protein
MSNLRREVTTEQLDRLSYQLHKIVVYIFNDQDDRTVVEQEISGLSWGIVA